MQVHEIMTSNPTCCSTDTTIQEAAKLMDEKSVGAIPVINDAGEPVGIITDRDICCGAVAEGKAADTPVSDVMSVDCHRELTRQLQKLSLRIDPCVTLPLLESAGSYWSVRHGISEDYSEMGSARQDAHPRDCAPDRGVSQHDQEVSADRDS